MRKVTCLFLLVGSLFAVGYAIADVLSQVAAPLENILAKDWADQLDRDAAQILHGVTQEISARLPAHLQEDLANSLAARLRALQTEAESSLSMAHRSAWVAHRLMELSELVLHVPYRPIPQDRASHDAAIAQLRQLEQDCRDYARAKFGATPDVVLNQLVDLMLTNIVRAQKDILSLGYGQPLTETERADLKTLITGAIDKIAPGTEQNTTRDSVQDIAQSISVRISALCRAREQPSSPEWRDRLAKWSKDNQALLKQISEKLDQSRQEESRLRDEKEEIEIDRMRRDEETRYRDLARYRKQLMQDEGLSPKVIAAPLVPTAQTQQTTTAAASSTAKSASPSSTGARPIPPPTSPPAPGPTQGPPLAAVLLPILVVICALAVLFLVLRRKHA